MLFGIRVENGPDCFVKDLSDPLLQKGRALQISHRTNAAGQRAALLRSGWTHPLLFQLLQGLLVPPQVSLSAYQQHRHAGTVVAHLRVPFMPDVGVRGRAGHRETDDEDVRLRVGQGSQAVVLLLTGRVPQVEADGTAVHTGLSAVVVKNRRNVLVWEGVSSVGDQQAGLSHCTIANNYTLYGLHFVAWHRGP